MFLYNTEEKRETFLSYSNATEDDILFKEELDGYMKKFPDFSVHYFVDKVFRDDRSDFVYFSIFTHTNLLLGKYELRVLPCHGGPLISFADS